MKRFIAAICLLVFLSPVLNAQDISRAERAQAVTYLAKTRADLLAATRGLSERQWNFKPETNRWSVAEVTEHLAASEDLMMGMVQDKVMKAPARTEGEDVKALDAFILQKIPDRSNKVQAPEPLRPGNRFGSPKESLKHFRESRAKTIRFLKDTKDLRQHAADSPFGKKFDAYQWMLVIAAHTDRHLQQLNEVKADPNFPKK
ncbi:MAG: DinB family protein [Akkermansiaceae bacterium]|nr:DinB family protein [Verrucomicrobiales bacterium]